MDQPQELRETVLVAFDGSPLGARALEYALERFPTDDLVVIHVVDPVHAVYEAELRGPREAADWSARVKAASERLLEDAKTTTNTHGASVTTRSLTGKPERRILETIDEEDVDHVVMGSHGRRGVSRLVMGSTAEAVMRQSPVPVTVVR